MDDTKYRSRNPVDPGQPRVLGQSSYVRDDPDKCDGKRPEDDETSSSSITYHLPKPRLVRVETFESCQYRPEMHRAADPPKLSKMMSAGATSVYFFAIRYGP